MYAVFLKSPADTRIENSRNLASVENAGYLGIYDAMRMTGYPDGIATPSV